MFETALKAKLPFIGVSTDDPVNCLVALHYLANKTVQRLPALGHPITFKYLYYTENPKDITVEQYKKLAEETASCVVLNQPPNSLVFETGVLPTPEVLIRGYLKDFMEEDKQGSIVHALRGLSLKTASEVAQLTMARAGAITPQGIRLTRTLLTGSTPGLYPLEVDFNFYQMPKEIQDWLDLNRDYFLAENIPQELVPRGLMLVGEPGVGKSMASMAIAKEFDVPLYRLDIAGTMNRYLGEAESRLIRNFSIMEQNSPCVCLIDETEKLFNNKGDEGTSSRMEAQLLWWLQYHRARIITIMTSNSEVKEDSNSGVILTEVPAELYRPGRVDKVIRIPKLGLQDSRSFAYKVYENIMKEAPMSARRDDLRKAIEKLDRTAFSHAEITGIVESTIKQKGWLNVE